jgi:hypothetical protein
VLTTELFDKFFQTHPLLMFISQQSLPPAALTLHQVQIVCTSLSSNMAYGYNILSYKSLIPPQKCIIRTKIYKLDHIKCFFIDSSVKSEVQFRNPRHNHLDVQPFGPLTRTSLLQSLIGGCLASQVSNNFKAKFGVFFGGEVEKFQLLTGHGIQSAHQY